MTRERRKTRKSKSKVIIRVNFKSIERSTMLTNIIFLIFRSNEKTKNNPNTNNINGILFPVKNNPIPKMHITTTVEKNFAKLLFLNVMIVKNIVKKLNLSKYPPAIFSSPKNPELRKSRPFKPIMSKP